MGEEGARREATNGRLLVFTLESPPPSLVNSYLYLEWRVSRR